LTTDYTNYHEYRKEEKGATFLDLDLKPGFPTPASVVKTPLPNDWMSDDQRRLAVNPPVRPLSRTHAV
jgi:hypothetical protein